VINYLLTLYRTESFAKANTVRESIRACLTMALEFVGGAFLSAFLQVAFQKLASPQILDFFRVRKLDQKLLYKLETKLHSIHSLADAAERKQFTYPHVRSWLLKVKDIVLDVEDLLDDIQMFSKRELDADSESQVLTGCTCKVLNFFKSSSISSHNKEIESRMEQILEDLEFLSSQKGALGLKTTSGVRSGLSNELPQKSQTSSLVVGTDIYGRDHDKKQIVDWLISDTNNSNQPSILSIVGMGGLGKTTLARHVFSDPRINEVRFDVKAWVCVSDEFDVFKVSRAILEAVTKSTDDSRDLEMVHTRLKEKLTKKKFLLVLDDVWNENKPKWEELQKPLMFGVQGSKIIVTTRSKEVASTMRSEVHSLKQLQEDDCWNLFLKYAFKDDDTQQNLECREIGMKIVERCKGLPLALKAMGSLLYNKSSISEWKSVFQSEIWEFSQEHCDIVPALALSYVHLPSHLKVCFAYCALFPKDYEFKKEHLMHLWMTEDLLHCPSEKVCQQYFNDLLSRSFFQQLGEEEEVFVMHDLLNDLAKYVGGGIYFKWEIGEKDNIQKVTRHFSVELKYHQYFDGFKIPCITERLRTFMPTTGRRMDSFARWNINMSIHDFFSKFRLLRILSLSHCSDIKELPDSVGNLEHLRLLDLSYIRLKKLSEKICTLSHLQILKLNYCRSLKQLPSNLHLLTNLCRLELIANNLKKLPSSLGKLTNLKVVMNSFNVGRGREFSIQQLGELNFDGSLSIRELQNIENSLDASKAYLKNKTLLVKLELQWGWDRDSIDLKKEEEVIKNLQPSENLKELEIFQYGGKQFPNWLHSLPNLVSLYLNGCGSCERLPPLGLLPFLKDLSIAELDGIVNIDADFYGSNSSSFKSLQSLKFSHLGQWEKWDCKAGVFPRLQYLTLISCPKLKGVLPEQLVPLKEIRVINCQQLEASTPKALALTAEDCGKLHLDWATMKSLILKASLLEIVWSDTVEYLYITLNSRDYCVALRIFPLDFFPKLKRLELSGFPNLQMISQDHIHNHLEGVTIDKCPKFESLPANMHMLFPSLNELHITDCPKHEWCPEGGLPSNLKVMTLSCSRLHVGSLKRPFRDNSSLERLCIEKVEAECFPNEGLLPLSLIELTIYGCPNLEKLNYKGLYRLSSLQSLVLDDCPNLQCLPEEGLPNSISYLYISRCPLLKQRCQEGGEDRQKIAHIQHQYLYC